MKYFPIDQSKLETSKKISEGCTVSLCYADIPYGFTVKEMENHDLFIKIDYLIATEEESVSISIDDDTICYLGKYSSRLLGFSVCPRFSRSDEPTYISPRVVGSSLEGAVEELYDKEDRWGSKLNYKAVEKGLGLMEDKYPDWISDFSENK